MGVSDARIIMTHIIPNSMSQIIVNVTLNLGTAILTASSVLLSLGVTRLTRNGAPCCPLPGTPSVAIPGRR